MLPCYYLGFNLPRSGKISYGPKGLTMMEAYWLGKRCWETHNQAHGMGCRGPPSG